MKKPDDRKKFWKRLSADVKKNPKISIDFSKWIDDDEDNNDQEDHNDKEENKSSISDQKDFY